MDGGEALRVAGLARSRSQGGVGVDQRHPVHGRDRRAGAGPRAPTGGSRIWRRRSRWRPCGSRTPFSPEIQALRPHPGQVASAANLFALLDGSQINESHRWWPVQDAYSLRCSPQVRRLPGRDRLCPRGGRDRAERRTDNPLVFADRDECCRTATSMASRWRSRWIRSRSRWRAGRDQRAADRADGESDHERGSAAVPDRGRPQLRLHDPPLRGRQPGGREQGAVPSRVGGLNPDQCWPGGSRLDGRTAAHHAWQVCHNVEQVLAVELLCGAQGLDFLAPLRPGPGIAALRGAAPDVAAPRRRPLTLIRDRSRRRAHPRRLLLATVERAFAALD